MSDRIPIRQLRAHLKTYLDGDRPVLVGDRYNVRAIVIPIPEYRRYDPLSYRKGLARARKLWRRAVHLAFPDQL